MSSTTGLNNSRTSKFLDNNSLETASINHETAGDFSALLEGKEFKFGGHTVKIVLESLEARMLLVAALKTASEAVAASSVPDRPATASSLLKAAKLVKENSPEFQKHLAQSRARVEKGFQLFVASQATYKEAQTAQNRSLINTIPQGNPQLNPSSASDKTTKVVSPIADKSKNIGRDSRDQVTKEKEEQRTAEHEKDIEVEEASWDKKKERQEKRIEQHAEKARATQKAFSGTPAIPPATAPRE